MINVDASAKNIMNPATCSCENGKYLASIIDNSVITCDEITDAETKTIPTNFNEKNITCKTRNFYIFFAFLINYHCIIDSS